MYCRICGDERNTTYHAAQRQALCPSCARTTPAKVGRDEFERQYWGAERPYIPESTAREFYSDYLASSHTLSEYIRVTQAEIDAEDAVRARYQD